MGSEYWDRFRSQRHSRRSVLGGAAALGGGLAGLALVGCGDDDDDDDDDGGPEPGDETPQPGGETPAAGEPKTGGRVQRTNSEPDAYDPHRDAGYPGLVVMSGVYNRLLRTRLPIGQDFTIEPDLATAWEQPDDQTYSFTLAENVTWQDVEPTNGRAFTSEDVKLNFERMVNPGGDFVLRSMFEMIDTIETPDDTTIVVHTEFPYGPLIANSADVWAVLIPSELHEGDDSKVRPVGTGPFIFREAQQGVSQTLDKNPNYFKPGQPYVDGIDYTIFADEPLTLAAFQNGEIDTLFDFASVAGQKAIQQDHPDAIYDKRLGVPSPIMINNSVEPLNDVRVRQALALATDYDAVINVGYQGEAVRAQPVPVWLRKYNLEDSELPQRDVAQAMKLLEAAGLGDGFQITDKTFQGGENFFGTLQVQQAWKDINVDMVIEPMEWANWRVNVYGPKGDFEITMGGEFDFLSPDRQLYNAFHSNGSANNRHVNDPDLDALIEGARQELDEDAAVEKWKDVSRYLLDNANTIWLVNATGVVGVQPWVKNWFWMYTQGGLLEHLFLDELWLDKA